MAEYHPISSVQNRAPIDFDIPGSGERYIDTRNIQLYVRAKIIRGTAGNTIYNDATVTPVNLLLHSMFSHVDILLNGTLISNSTNTYPYRAMLETLLSYGCDADIATDVRRSTNMPTLMESTLIRADNGNKPNK